MANFKLVNSDQLDTDLKSVADKIREASQLSNPLAFPEGFVDGIDQCSSLNFSIVGGTTKPEKPAENTIWLNTDKEISGWAVSYEQPGSPKSGMVWIKNSTSGVGLNVLKKNEIKIYPKSVQLYTAGEWQDVESAIYQNGEWGDLESGFVIYEDGTFGKNTDGTTFTAGCADDGAHEISIETQSDHMKWSCGDDSWGIFYIQQKCSCEGYSKLNIQVSEAAVSVDTEGVRWGLAQSLNPEDPGFVAFEQYEEFTGDKTLNLDVSNVDPTPYYIILRVSTANYETVSMKVKKIWFE